jgi:hypothetical protein
LPSTNSSCREEGINKWRVALLWAKVTGESSYSFGWLAVRYTLADLAISV